MIGCVTVIPTVSVTVTVTPIPIVVPVPTPSYRGYLYFQAQLDVAWQGLLSPACALGRQRRRNSIACLPPSGMETFPRVQVISICPVNLLVGK